jgi:two-component system, NarL family, invasion response regulator UvrY
MRVLIVDDHPFIRKGIRETLVDAISMVEIEEATDGDQAFDILAARAFDLVIVDVSMPGKDGLELIKDTLAIRPGVRFLMMSVFPEREFAERAYRDGAMGYLDKASPPSQFLEAVRRILGGRTYVSPEYAETLVTGRGAERMDGALLTDRELAVVARYSAGDSLMEIGRQLRLSVKTVSTYKTRAMEKLGIANNAELIAYAIAHGLARPRSP